MSEDYVPRSEITLIFETLRGEMVGLRADMVGHHKEVIKRLDTANGRLTEIEQERVEEHAREDERANIEARILGAQKMHSTSMRWWVGIGFTLLMATNGILATVVTIVTR